MEKAEADIYSAERLREFDFVCIDDTDALSAMASGDELVGERAAE